MKFLITRYFSFFLFLLSGYSVKAQACAICATLTGGNDSLFYTVSKLDTLTYTVSAGQTFCIQNTGVFKGSIVNNGGTICNQGRFFPRSFTWNSGTLINSKIMKLRTNILLGSSCSFINTPDGILNLDGDLGLSGGTLKNEGLINSKGDLHNSSGTLENKAIINCHDLTGSNSIQSFGRGIINTKN